jgi:3-hydroxyisobutyrate dehydrogenase
MDNRTIGLVGVGMMGWPMANCMISAGLDLVFHDSDSERARRCQSEVGGRAIGTLAELAAEANIVITMLPNSAIVSDVLFGEGDALAPALRQGSIVIEMSSGAPHVTISLAERLAGQGVAMIDAPVSGGVPRAVTGKLTIMVGGDPDVAARCTDVLETMGSVNHVGILGAGQAMKALNNLVSAGGFLVGIEALLIGQKFGLSADLMVDVLNSSSGMNNSTKNKFKQYVLSRQFEKGGFGIGLMAKDVGIAMDIAKSTATPAPFSALCSQMWAAAATMLGPERDHTEIARMCETFANATLGSDATKE